MNDTILYRETLPKFVFKGDRHTRRGIEVVQWAFRGQAVFIFLLAIFLMFTPKSEHDAPIVWSCIPLIWIGFGLVLSTSEGRQQAELDGNTPTIIYEDRISIPPRRFRKLTSKQDFIHKEQVNGIEVLRGSGCQYFTKKDCIIWLEAPVGLKIVTKSGKKYNLGYKPPKTVREITGLLVTKWGVPVKDKGFGMGKGMKHVNNQIIGEFSYDEIMNMNILPWQ
jgi:hypothetical protein